MTALLTAETAQDLDTERATVSQNAVDSLTGTRSSTGNLKAGETYSLRQLLYLLMLPSGNDSANVLAEYFCTTNDLFVEKMNERAAQLGMQNTHFVNPHGLHHPEHYTTAKDMALLAAAYLRVPVLKAIASAAEYTVPATNLQAERTVKTTNLMKLPNSGYYYSGAYGLKTGNTDEAGRCLIASAEKDGLDLICVLMNCPARYTRTSVIRCEFLEAASIFDYAFCNYTYRQLYPADYKIAEKPVGDTFHKTADAVLATDIYATLPKDADNAQLTLAAEWNKTGSVIQAPVSKGAVLGTAEVRLNGETVAQAKIVAAQSIQPNRLIVFWKAIDLYVYCVLGVLAALVCLFLALVLRAQIIRRKRRKRKNGRR